MLSSTWEFEELAEVIMWLWGLAKVWSQPILCTHTLVLYSAIQFSRATTDHFHTSTFIYIYIYSYTHTNVFAAWLGREKVGGGVRSRDSQLSYTEYIICTLYCDSSLYVFKGMHYVVRSSSSSSSIRLYIACWQAISCPVQSVCICCTIDWSICQ